ncbi:hypothetical protein EMO91_11155, partial [Bifidobacterium myosotis]
MSLEERFQNMTGNTKVWRAPLAGLASVAMIATMGVAASTANAAPSDWKYGDDVKVTLDANGGSFADGSQSKPVTDKQAGTDATYADGVFEGTDAIYNKYAGNVPSFKDGSRVFTGWYESKSAGQAVAPDAVLADGTTLYAHWRVVDSDESEYAVIFNFDGKVDYDFDADVLSSGVITEYGDGMLVQLADNDTLAPWEYAATDRAGDSRLFQGEWSVNPSNAVKGPNAITPKTVNAVNVTVDNEGYTLYKDGKVPTATNFDAAPGATVDGLVAYRASDHTIANVWTAKWGDVTKDVPVEAGKVSPTLPSDVSAEVTLTPKTKGVSAYKVETYTKNKTEPTKSYFAQKGWPLAETVDEAPARAHAQFKGWYNPVAYDDKGMTVSPTHTNDAYIDGDLTYKEQAYGDPVEFDFGSEITADTKLYAVYTADAKYKEITLDPNYDGADPIVVKVYEGKTIGSQLPTVTRDGYTLENWYNNKNFTGGALDRSVVADFAKDVPHYTYYYAKWTADSKGGVQGLLAKLHLGYNADWTTKDNTDSKGYVATSWSKFVSAREDVLAALRKLP